MYPYIYYEKGDVNEWANNEPLSYLLGFITGLINYKYTYGCDDLPEDETLLVDEFGYVYEDEDSRTLVNLKEIGREYPWVQEEPEAVGATYELEVEKICGRRGYEDMREMLENDGFIFKAEYNAVRAYLERIKATQEKDDDFFRELL